MIELVTARYLRNFLKAQIIIIRLAEWKNYMYKISTQLCYPGNSLVPVGYADHGFSCFYTDLPYLFKLIYKVMIQHKRVGRFACKELRNLRVLLHVDQLI